LSVKELNKNKRRNIGNIKNQRKTYEQEYRMKSK